jgi:hypothetical protein
MCEWAIDHHLDSAVVPHNAIDGERCLRLRNGNTVLARRIGWVETVFAQM